MQTPRNILIIRFGSLGDVLLTTPFIRVLRNRLPEAHIQFLVKHQYAELLRDNPHLSSVWELRSNQRSEVDELRRRIREARFDTVFDLHNSLRSRYIRRGSGAAHVGVINKYVVRRFLLVHLKMNLYRDAIPVTERYLRAGGSLNLQDDGLGLEVFVSEEARGVADAMVRGLRASGHRIVALAPTARHQTKQWPLERFADAAELITAGMETRFAIFGGEAEQAQCERLARSIEARLGRGSAENFAGRLSLIQTAAALDHCAFAISNDTGLMHLAAARKKSVVAIFGPTVREFGFFPYGTRNIVVEHPHLPCRPCSHIGREHCPEGHFACMNDIPAERVRHAVERLARAEEPIEFIANEESLE